MLKTLFATTTACVILFILSCSNPFSNNQTSIITADNYESDDTQSTAKQIYPDSTGQLRTLKKEDVDWVYFYATAGKSYKIFTTGSTDTRIRVYTSSSSTVPVAEGNDLPGDNNASVVVNATTNLTYYVCVNGNDPDVSGGYILSVTSSIGLDSYEPDSVPRLAYYLSTSYQSRTINEGDVDWAKCSLTAGDTVLLTATGNCLLTMSLYGSDTTTLLTSTSTADSNSYIKYRVGTSGYYFLRISGKNYTTKGSYRLTMQTNSSGTLVIPDEYENDNTKNNAKLLQGSTVQQRSLTIGDTDWIRFPVVSGRQYTVTFSSSYAQGTMYSKDGTLLQGPLYSLSLNSSANDTVFVRITSTSSYAFNYTLTFTALLMATVADDYENDNTKALAKVKYFPQDSFIQDRTLTYINSVPDTDWVAFHMIAGKRYTISYNSTSSSSMYMYLYDNISSSYVSYSSSSSSPIIYTPTISDTAYLMIRSSGYTATAYTLSVQGQFSNDSYEPDSSRSTAKTISTFIQSHILLPNDTDWVTYTSTPGDSFVIMTTGTTDTKISLFSSSGSTPLAENDDIGSGNTNASIGWKSQMGGQFYARITGKTPAVTGSYMLQLLSVSSGTIVAADSFENDNSKLKAKIIFDTVLNSQTHSLTMNDTDWVAFPVLAGGSYTVSVSSNSYLNMYAYTSKDSLITSRNDYTSTSITYSPPANDTMYIRLTPYSSTVSRYTLSMSRIAPPSPDIFENDNTKAKARIITDTLLNAEVHSLPLYDTDWVAFPVLAGGSYTVSVSGASYLNMYAYTSKDSLISARTDYSSTSITFNAPKNDTMYVRLTPYSSGVQRYTLSMSRIAPPGPDIYENDNSKAKARIILDSSLNAEAHSLPLFDTDWVAFPVKAGGSYTVTASSLSSNSYLNIYAYTSKDSVIASRIDYSSTSIIYNATKNDTMYIQITPYASGVQRYTLSMSRILPDQYENDNSRQLANSIKLDSIQYHYLGMSDTDWVRIPVTGGSTYKVITSASIYHYVYLYLGSSSSYYTYGSSTSNSLTVTPPTDDTLFVQVRQYSVSTSYTGPYTIKITTN